MRNLLTNKSLKDLVGDIDQRYADPKTYAKSMLEYISSKTKVINDRINDAIQAACATGSDGLPYNPRTVINKVISMLVGHEEQDQKWVEKSKQLVPYDGMRGAGGRFLHLQPDLEDNSNDPEEKLFTNEPVPDDVVTDVANHIGTVIPVGDTVIDFTEYYRNSVYVLNGYISGNAPRILTPNVNRYVSSNEVSDAFGTFATETENVTKTLQGIADGVVEDVADLEQNASDIIGDASKSPFYDNMVSVLKSTNGSTTDTVKAIASMISNAAADLANTASDKEGNFSCNIKVADYENMSATQCYAAAVPVAFNTVASAIGKVFGAIAGVIEGVFQLGKKLIGKIVDYVRPLVTNPIITYKDGADRKALDFPFMSVQGFLGAIDRNKLCPFIQMDESLVKFNEYVCKLLATKNKTFDGIFSEVLAKDKALCLDMKFGQAYAYIVSQDEVPFTKFEEKWDPYTMRVAKVHFDKDAKSEAAIFTCVDCDKDWFDATYHKDKEPGEWQVTESYPIECSAHFTFKNFENPNWSEFEWIDHTLPDSGGRFEITHETDPGGVGWDYYLHFIIDDMGDPDDPSCDRYIRISDGSGHFDAIIDTHWMPELPIHPEVDERREYRVPETKITFGQRTFIDIWALDSFTFKDQVTTPEGDIYIKFAEYTEDNIDFTGVFYNNEAQDWDMMMSLRYLCAYPIREPTITGIDYDDSTISGLLLYYLNSHGLEAPSEHETVMDTLKRILTYLYADVDLSLINTYSDFHNYLCDHGWKYMIYKYQFDIYAAPSKCLNEHYADDPNIPLPMIIAEEMGDKWDSDDACLKLAAYDSSDMKSMITGLLPIEKESEIEFEIKDQNLDDSHVVGKLADGQAASILRMLTYWWLRGSIYTMLDPEIDVSKTIFYDYYNQDQIVEPILAVIDKCTLDGVNGYTLKFPKIRKVNTPDGIKYCWNMESFLLDKHGLFFNPDNSVDHKRMLNVLKHAFSNTLTYMNDGIDTPLKWIENTCITAGTQYANPADDTSPMCFLSEAFLGAIISHIVSNKFEYMYKYYDEYGDGFPVFIPYKETFALDTFKYHLQTTDQMMKKAIKIATFVVAVSTIILMTAAIVAIKFVVKRKLNGVMEKLSNKAESLKYDYQMIQTAYLNHTPYVWFAKGNWTEITKDNRVWYDGDYPHKDLFPPEDAERFDALIAGKIENANLSIDISSIPTKEEYDYATKIYTKGLRRDRLKTKAMAALGANSITYNVYDITNEDDVPSEADVTESVKANATETDVSGIRELIIGPEE